MRRTYIFMDALKKVTLMFAVVICISLGFLGKGNAQQTRVFFYDPDKLLSQTEKEDLIDKMSSLSIEGGVGVIILPADGNRSTETDTRNASYPLYTQLCGYDDGVAFVMDMETRYIEVVSYGEYSKKITSYDAAVITDNVYRYASDGQYFMTIDKALDQIERKIGNRQIPQKMKWICNLFFAMIISLILNFFLLKATSKLPEVKNTSALKNAQIDVKYNNVEEHFDHKTVADYKPGSIEAIKESKGPKAKTFQIFLFILNVLILILKIMGSGGGGGRSGGGRSGGGRSGGGRSGGGGRSSGGHRF